MYVREDVLIDQVECWVKKNISESFDFRPYQLETIVMILQNALNNSKVQVMEAPTGSGKSYIGIISAGVLWEYYKKRSYILASDLALYKQYEDTIKKYHLPWGMLKGQDNYICQRNGHQVSMGHCKINQVSFARIANTKEADSCGYACGASCQYVQDLIKAAKSPVTLMTYALYFIKVVGNRNVTSVNPNGVDLSLNVRDFIVCDEAHNLPSLVQQHFSPDIDKENIKFVDSINEFAEKNNDKITTSDSIKEVIDYAIKFSDLNNFNAEGLRVCSERIEQMLGSLQKYCSEVMLPETKTWRGDDKKEAARYVNAASSISDLFVRFQVFNELIRSYSEKAIVSSINKSGNGFKLNCAYEDKLIYNYFHKKTNCELLMSATIGDLDVYKCLIGAAEYKDNDFCPIEVPSTFDFTKSPIYYSTQYKMSYREKASSISHIVNKVIEICNKNSDVKGIIHTGSYEIAQAFYNAIPNSIRYRVINYNDSRDKRQALQRFINSKNGILVGPSLIEGLSFDYDLCRFNIFMKLPYASLGDNLVKAKMRLFPDWYSLDVCSRLDQGIGRGVRAPDDWCTTYILDGCIDNIINDKNQIRNLCKTTRERLIKMD